MIDESRISLYNYLSGLFNTITNNVYSMDVPTETTSDDADNGFIVVRLGDIQDDSEFIGDAYGWVRCYVIAYVPKKSRGRLNKDLYKTFEDGINEVIKQAQDTGDGSYYILPDSVISSDDDETAQQGNQYHVFIKSFVVVIDQPQEE